MRFLLQLCAIILFGSSLLVGGAGISPADAAPDTAPPIPFTFSYHMPLDGVVAIHILDAQGRIVRRLVAETPRSTGRVTEGWDLRDDRGQYPPPGVYHWQAVARPPLKLTYELTVNNAGQPPWWISKDGRELGGWLADHGAPVSACAVGDLLFFGSGCAENGHAAIATDVNGNKRWGVHYVLEGFQGTERIASDGRYAYLLNDFGVLRVDPLQDFQSTELLRFHYTPNVPSGGRWWDAQGAGAAIVGDRLYVGYRAPAIPWITSSFLADEIDPAQCQPPVRMTRGKRENYPENAYDELLQLAAAFLTGTPPSSIQAYFGDAPKSGPLAGTVTVVFKHPVPVGSVFIPNADIRVYALKPGLTPADIRTSQGEDPEAGQELQDAFAEEQWLPLTVHGATKGGPAVATLAQAESTRALRFATNRLLFAQVLNRRFADVAPEAARVCGEGSVTPHGGWTVTRPPTTPMNGVNPPRMALVWDTPQRLRGVGLSRPATAVLAVDAWSGPAGDDPKTALADDTLWQPLGVLEPEVFNSYWPQTPTARTLDFGREVATRALRIRAIAPAETVGPKGIHHAVNETQRAGFDAVVAFSHLDGDPELPPELNDRITEIQLPAGDGTQAKVLRQIPLSRPGYLATDHAGVLYAVSDRRIVTVPLAGGEPRVVIPAGQLEAPAGMAFDAEGLLYVADGGPGVIKVFDVLAGKLVRTIGTPGGARLGKWDPTRLDNPTGVAIDHAGKLWVVENSYQPKRVSRWTRDGKIEQWFLGPTAYGGGGWMDQGNHGVVMYHGMKFIIDWATRGWTLDSLLFRPGLPGSLHAAMPDRVVYARGHRYLVGDPGNSGGSSVAVICEERDGVARPLAAAGNLGHWEDVALRPDLRQAFGALQGENYGFVWFDRNGDRQPQAGEVQITDRDKFQQAYFSSRVGDDLAFVFRGVRLRPSGLLADGTPTYDLAKLESFPLLQDSSWSTEDGRIFQIGDSLLAADGTLLWAYPDLHLSTHGSQRVSWDRPPGTLVGEFQVVGHFTVGQEELFVTNANHGDWYVFTRDGFLAATIFGGPAGTPRRWWTMPEWTPGKTDLSGLNVGEEHFQGSICRAEDGAVYAIAGHNHNSIVRVDGLEGLTRLGGTLTITRQDLEQAQEWAVRTAALDARQQEPKAGLLPQVRPGQVTVDGSLDDWPASIFLTIHSSPDPKGKTIIHSSGALAYDRQYLYVAARAADLSPMRNTADDPRTLFKSGDAVDVTLGLDPTADPLRPNPVPGDVRLLISMIKGTPVAVIYRPHVPGTPPETQVRFTSPVGQIAIDQVTVLDHAAIAIRPDGNGWIVEAAIPWQQLGSEPPALAQHLKADIGILQSDEQGARTVSRLYWSGKTQTVVSDIPTEARLFPTLWGDLLTVDGDEKGLHWGPG